MRVVEILEELIRFPTLPEHPNAALLEYVSEHVRRAGVEPALIMEPCGERGSLVALIGPRVPGGIVLSAHSDVVAVEGQQWNVLPWRLTSNAGRLYGRGTADMKGFIACCLDLLPRIDTARLRRPLIFAISHDEEIGCKGAPMLVRHIAGNLPRPASVIVGEPTSMRIVDGHKGVAVYETHVRGCAAHSSLPHTAASATLAAARLIVHLAEIAARRRDGSHHACAFSPSYTTLNVGIVRGGEASNIVAAECVLRWDVRPIPGDDPQSILDELHEYAERVVLPEMRLTTPDARIVTQVFASAPPLAPQGDPTARELAMRIAHDSASSVASFTTEAGLFQEAGMSAVVCGPGSIEQAHKPDEFVEVSQLEACSRFLHTSSKSCRPEQRSGNHHAHPHEGEPMSYILRTGQRYRMPTHFGPSLGPRQGPEGRRYDCIDTPKQVIVRAAFKAEAAQLVDFLPPRFELRSPTLIYMTFCYITDVDWLAGRGYNTFGVSVPASYQGRRESIEGELLLVLWENMADPIVTGREELGFSKVYCELPEPQFVQDDVVCRASWDGCQFATLRLARVTGIAVDALPAPQPSAGLLHYKYIPRTGAPGEADAEYPVLTPATNSHLKIDQAMIARGAACQFRQSTWEELPTLMHIVNALSAISLGECVEATVMRTRGAKDLSDQRILD